MPTRPERHHTVAPDPAVQCPPLNHGSDDPEYNLAILTAMVSWFHAAGRGSELAAIASEAGTDPSWLGRRHQWVSWAQFEALLSAVRARVGDDDRFLEICRYDFAANYHWRMLAGTPAKFFEKAESLGPYFSSAGRYEVVSCTRTTARIRWWSRHPESRLACLTRVAQTPMVPTLWGLPPAQVREHACLSRGDPCCDYEYRWHAPRRQVRAVLLGGTLGFLAVLGVPGAVHEAPLLAWTLPAVGALTALLADARVTNRANRIATEDMARELRVVMMRQLVKARRDESRHVPAVRAGGPPAFRREGDVWRLEYAGTVIRVRHARGIALLAYLVAHAGDAIHVRDLEAATPANGVVLARSDDHGTATIRRELGDLGPLLDRRAKREYRRRVAELDAAIERAAGASLESAVTSLRAERETLSTELRAAVGLGGRDRRAGSDVERMRVAITRRIRAALDHVASLHPQLGAHLKASVRTGYACSYDPARAAPPALRYPE